MATIGRIRKHSGLIVIIVGIALAAFVLGDFVRKGPRRESMYIGEIGSEKIGYREFEVKFEEAVDNYKRQTGKENLNQDEQYQIRQQTWSQLVNKVILAAELEKLGIFVSTAELNDLISGTEPHPFIVQNFTDPKTGQFNRSNVVNFMANIEQLEPEVQDQWYQIQRAIREERLTNKYNTLISQAYYVPTPLAKKDYEAKNTIYKCRFLALNYNTIADSTVKVTEKELETYYKKHKNEYEQEASRALAFVIFDILPSGDDRTKAQELINKVKTELEKNPSDDIASFVRNYSDKPYDSTWLKKGELPIKLDSIMFNSSKGAIVGPYFENGAFHVAQLIDVTNRPDSMQATHILIAYQGALRADENVKRNKDQAKLLSDSLFEVIKKKTDLIKTLAPIYSNDGSVQANAGDLGMFKDGQMVPQFNEGCLKAKVGDVFKVETAFGFHIVQLTKKLEPVKKVRVAIIEQALEPSTKTKQDMYNIASNFVGSCSNLETFEKALVENKLNKRIADYIREMDMALPGVGNSRDIVRWAFDEQTNKEAISQIYDYDDKFVVAIVTEKREKGFASLAQIKDQIEKLAIRDKKADMLIEKMKQAGGEAANLDAISLKLKAPVDTAFTITFASYNLPRTGPEPDMIGYICSAEKGKLSSPLKGKSGVFMFTVDEITPAPAVTDYSQARGQMGMMFKSRINYSLNTALEKAYNIKDNRRFFY